MVKSAEFYCAFRIHNIGYAYIYKNVCNHFYILIYFLVIAKSFTYISITPTLMVQDVRFARLFHIPNVECSYYTTSWL